LRSISLISRGSSAASRTVMFVIRPLCDMDAVSVSVSDDIGSVKAA
jgi:hypothetical protein